MTHPVRLALAPRQWLALPGTGYEVLLHGKYRDSGDRVLVTRNGDGPGGWDLRPLYGSCFIRKARS